MKVNFNKCMDFSKIGLVDLHLHLDGSLSLNSVKELMEIQGMANIYSDDELTEKLQVSDDCRDLNEYLEKFDFPLALLQTEKAIGTAVVNLVKELEEQGIIYAEIRFAPQLHTGKGMTQEQAVKAALDGLKSVGSTVAANLILCCMRGIDNYEENVETVKTAKKFLNNGVVAIDLAGAEGIFPTVNYEDIFELASENNIPFTIHAGEADDYTSVEYAVKFGAKRIGHGVRAAESKKTLDMLAEKKIALELCPTSNLNTNIYESIKEYPIMKLIKAGVPVTINTDNMTVSNTNIKKELTMLANAFDLDENDIMQIEKNAVKYSFADEKTKRELWKKMEIHIG